MVRKAVISTVLAAALLAFMAGCAAKKEKIQALPQVEAKKVSTKGKEQRVDSFLVILDTSGSQSKRYAADRRLDISRQLLTLMNHTIPQSLDLEAGMRVFGQIETEEGTQSSALISGMGPYTRAAFDQGLLDAPQHASDRTYMGQALEAAAEELRETSGRTAVILVSDGVNLDDDPMAAAASLKEEFGNRMCLSTIHIADDARGRQLMERIAGPEGCGVAAEGSRIAAPASMAEFVEKVFLTTPAPPEPKPEPAPQAPMDSDGDGYADAQDLCPSSPRNVDVDARGCWNIEHVLFDFDEDNIRPAFEELLDTVSTVMRKNPEMTLTVHGHTDSIGTEAYNLELSRSRAQAVKQHLSDQGVQGRRIAIEAHGEADPVATNESEWGRQQNRRAVLEPSRK